MRVTHVTSGLDRRSGGVAAAVIGLAAAQAKAGLRVTVLSTYVKGEDLTAVENLRSAGVAVRLVGPAYSRLMSWHPNNRRDAGRAVVDADVLHVHALWEDLQHAAMKAARRHHRPYVVSPHGMLATWSLRQRSLKKRLYLALRLRNNLEHANALHFTTEEEARQGAGLGLRPKPIVEGLGLDLAEFADLPERGSFRRLHPELADGPIVLFLSRLHPKKGLDILIPAFAQGDFKHARLVIAGPAEHGYDGVVRDLVRHHGLTDRTVFTGMLRGRDRIAALADADVFVLPSYQENFGIVVAEALAAGTPVVISDQVNFAECVQGRPFARVVPCDTRRVAGAIADRLAAGPTTDAADARAWALARFDWAAIAERWKAHYADVAAGR